MISKAYDGAEQTGTLSAQEVNHGGESNGGLCARRAEHTLVIMVVEMARSMPG